jgi:hypothetical protein
MSVEGWLGYTGSRGDFSGSRQDIALLGKNLECSIEYLLPPLVAG